jgi:hypothetical protein
MGFVVYFQVGYNLDLYLLFQQRIHALTNITTQVEVVAVLDKRAPIMQQMASHQAITINLQK